MRITCMGREAQIMSASNYLHVRFLDGLRPRYGHAHPTWQIDYRDAAVTPVTPSSDPCLAQ